MKRPQLRNITKSAWTFPTVISLLLLLLVVLQINGSSVGMYSQLFYGNVKDPALLAGIPRAIRSDEWVVNTPMTIAQKAVNFARLNTNIGNGEDMSVILDVPYKDWSEFFKPHNWAYFVLPLDNAFAFKWWFMAYCLMLAVYCFVLVLLPRKKLFASLLAVAVLFSPFVQWWYQYQTIGPIYLSLFIAAATICLIRTNSLLHKTLWGALVTYLLVCFALVLYPPFQIPCAIVVGVFLGLYLLHYWWQNGRRNWLQSIAVLSCAVLVSGLLVLGFVVSRRDVFQIITNTAYPGQRLVQSGGYSPTHFFSGSLDMQLLWGSKSRWYQVPAAGAYNQSEDSSFILLTPFLLLPSLYLVYKRYKEEAKFDFVLLGMTLLFLVFTLWLFIPGIPLLGKLLLLDKVPLNRLIIGFGLLNVVQLIVFMVGYSNYRKSLLTNRVIIGYAILVACFLSAIHIHIAQRAPGFIGVPKAVALALPVPITIYCLLKKRLATGLAVFMLFALLTALPVNPIYKGTGATLSASLSGVMKQLASRDHARWVSEVVTLENFPAMNGMRTLTGVYTYPQLSLWASASSDKTIYNRYAHVTINLARGLNTSKKTTLKLVGPDHFAVETSACDAFLRTEAVRYILTDGRLPDTCVENVDTVTYPAHTFYIYKLR